jgi:hypothetical protein
MPSDGARDPHFKDMVLKHLHYSPNKTAIELVALIRSVPCIAYPIDVWNAVRSQLNGWRGIWS